MIRVSVLYPNEQGKKFDHEYFTGSHASLVREQLSSRGLVRFEQEKGVSSEDPNTPAPFVAVAHLTFSTLDEVHNAFHEVGREVMGDIKNYTDIPPQVQISEIVD